MAGAEAQMAGWPTVGTQQLCKHARGGAHGLAANGCYCRPAPARRAVGDPRADACALRVGSRLSRSSAGSRRSAAGLRPRNGQLRPELSAALLMPPRGSALIQ